MIDETRLVQKYGLRQFVTREARKHSAVSVDEVIGQKLVRDARAAGFEPIEKPVLRWERVTQFHKDLNSVPEFVHVGDWHVFASVRTMAPVGWTPPDNDE